MKISLSFIILLFISAGTALCQPYKFSKTYNFNNHIAWNRSMLFHDSTILSNSDFLTDSSDDAIRLFEIDLNGNLISNHYFQKLHISYNWFGAGSLLQIDTCYYVGGSVLWVDSLNTSNGYSYPFLAKYNAHKDTIWVKQYLIDTTMYYQMGTCISTKDKGVIIAGSVSSKINSPGYFDFYFIKLDSSGNLLWHKQYGTSGMIDEGCICVLELDDSTLVLSGAKEYGVNNLGLLLKPWIIKTDKNGNLQWQKQYTMPSMQYGSVVLKKAWTNGFIMNGIGDTVINASDHQYPNYISKLNNNANFIWRTFFNDPMQIDIWDFDVVSNGKIIVCGTKIDTTYYSNGLPFGFMSLLDSMGNILWERTYVTDSADFNYLTCVRAAPDGGFVACGNATGTTGVQNDWVVRVDSNGCELPSCPPLGIKNISPSKQAIKIFPNPVWDILHIEADNVEQIEIVNTLGQVVNSIQVSLSQKQHDIDVRHLQSGIYFIRIDHQYSGKIIKQ